MPVQVLGPSTFEAVEVETAAAEMLSTHEIGRAYEQQIDPTLLQRLRETPTAVWDSSERLTATKVLHRVRPKHYFGILGELDLTWSTAALPMGEVGEVRVIAIPEFTQLAPSRKVSELTRRLDAGGRTSDDRFSAKYRLMRPRFDPTAMKGRPMLVAEQPDGPYVEFEGLTRLCCIQSRSVQGSESSGGVDVLLGTGPGVRRWQPFYGVPA
ncbi:MAG: hypothetical protein ACHQ2Y_02830 [Candidatus Lutacidiplasmatales archaeon]